MIYIPTDLRQKANLSKAIEFEIVLFLEFLFNDNKKFLELNENIPNMLYIKKVILKKYNELIFLQIDKDILKECISLAYNRSQEDLFENAKFLSQTKFGELNDITELIIKYYPKEVNLFMINEIYSIFDIFKKASFFSEKSKNIVHYGEDAHAKFLRNLLKYLSIQTDLLTKIKSLKI